MIANMTFDLNIKIIYKIRLFCFKCKYLLLAMTQCLPEMFARSFSYVADFNTRNKLLTQKLLKQGYRYHKLCKTFSKFYRRYYYLISKFQVGLKSLLRQGLSEPDFYGDLVYKLRRLLALIIFQCSSLK